MRRPNFSRMSLIDTLVYSTRLDIRIFRHVLFWTVDCISILVVLSADFEINWRIVVTRFMVIPLTASVAYFIIYYLIPNYSKDHNRVHLFLGLLAAVLFVAYGIRYYRLNIIYPLIDPTHIIPIDRWHINKVVRDTFRWIPGICFAVIIKMMKNRSELVQRNEKLMEEKKATELAFLRAQMHPHFLFNTLNTLYSYSLKAQDQSEKVVLHLSNLMRFILEECDKKLIPIEKEIKVITDYFELKKMRHGERLNVDCQVSLDSSPCFISPLLMLPIIENSCIHTLSSKTGKIDITVRIKSDKNFVSLFVENDLMNESNGTTHGTGLASVKRQLSLLYGSGYDFQAKSKNGKYTVNMIVPILKTDEVKRDG